MPLIFATTYLILSRVYGSLYSPSLSEIHFANYTLAGPGVTLLLFALGYSGVLSGELFNSAEGPLLAWGILLLWFIIAMGQLLFMVNTFRTAHR